MGWNVTMSSKRVSSMANINTNAKNYKLEGRIVWINFRIQMPFMFWFLGLFLSNIRSKLLSMPLSWMSHISSQLDGKLELVLNIQPNSMLDNFIPIGCFSPGYLLIVSLGLQIVKIEFDMKTYFITEISLELIIHRAVSTCFTLFTFLQRGIEFQ